MILIAFIAFVLTVVALLAVWAAFDALEPLTPFDSLDETAETFDMDAAVRQSRDLRSWRSIVAAVDFDGQPETPIYDGLMAERFEADARAEIARLTGEAS